MIRRSNVLIGWKEIAEYMNCSVATARRRESDGLPIFRTGRLIQAFPEDIDRWLRGQLARNAVLPSAQLESIDSLEQSGDVSALLATMMQTGGNERFAVIKLGKDVAEFEKIEVKLQSTEEKYRELLNTIPDWVWETDANGEFRYSSDRVKDIVGYTPDEIIGYHPNEFLIFKEDRDKFSDVFDTLSEKKRIVEIFVCRIETRAREIRYIESSATPTYDDNGDLSGYSGISRDVTQMIEADNALRKSKNLLDQILNGFYQEVLVIDREYNIEKANDAYCLRYRKSNEYITGKKCYRFSQNHSKPCANSGVICPVDEVFKSVMPFTIRRRHRVADGEYRTLDIFAFPLFDDAGNVISVVQIGQIIEVTSES